MNNIPFLPQFLGLLSHSTSSPAAPPVTRLAPLPTGMLAGDVRLPPSAAAPAARGIDARAALDMIGGETHGLQRVAHYLFSSRSIETYKDTRNGLIGADYSSKFSPWLSLGCISPRYVYWEIKRFEKLHVSNDSTYPPPNFALLFSVN